MLNVTLFTYNAFDENTYLVSNEHNQCWVIDPGMSNPAENKHFTDYLSEKQLKPQAIINTHAHIDHILGVQYLMDKYNIPFGMHEAETPVLKMGTSSAAMFGMHFPKTPQPTFYIKEGEPLKLGEDTLTVFHTPGHSPGSISYYYPGGNWVVAGDVLFSGSIGRTDLPGGNFDTLITAIRTKLFTLPSNTIVLSGHGEATTIAEEKMHNPFLK